MRRARFVTGEHVMDDIMLAIKDSEIKAEDKLVHMNQGQNATKE